MPSHTRRGTIGTTVCVGFVFVWNSVARRILLLLSINPWYADRFVRVLVVVGLRGACVGLCVEARDENESRGCSWRERHLS